MENLRKSLRARRRATPREDIGYLEININLQRRDRVGSFTRSRFHRALRTLTLAAPL